jgi:hypothetical protein
MIWFSIARTLDPGNLEVDPINFFGFAMLLMSIAGILVISMLIGVINQALSERVTRLRKGRSEVIENNHIVILGWNELIFLIISELIQNHRKKSPLVIAIMANKDKVEMEDIINQRIINKGFVRIICRTGNLLQPVDLKLMNLDNAKSIILLPYSKIHGDMACIKTLLAMKIILEKGFNGINIVSAFNHIENIRLAQIINPSLYCLDLSDIMGKIISHTCLQPGLSQVYRELLDYSGCQFNYTNRFSSLAGIEFGVLLHYFESSTLAGILEESGTTVLNPPMNRIYQANEQLIFISEGIEAIEIRKNLTDLVKLEYICERKHVHPAQSILMIGWNWRAHWVIKELNNFVPEDSKIKIFTNDNHCFEEISRMQEMNELNKLNVAIERFNISFPDTLEMIDYSEYDHIVIMSCCDTDIKSHSDSTTISTLLRVHATLEKKNVEKANLIIELEDERNRSLINSISVDDIVISDFYAGLLMSQVSENVHLLDLFNNLFNSEGSEIYIKPVEEYVDITNPINFFTVVESAKSKKKSEIAIGYKISRNDANSSIKFDIVLNPKKSELIRFQPQDYIIVIAEDC